MNLNSAEYWFPLIVQAGLPVPQTEFVPYDHRNFVLLEDREGDEAAWESVVDQAKKTAAAMGYPVFIRTDLTSAKHGGLGACVAYSEVDMVRVLYLAAEDSEMKLWLDSRNGPRSFLLRRFLKLPAPFTAFGGLPISREWRFFANRAGVACHHPYWPEEAIRFWQGSREQAGWQQMLRDLYAEDPFSELLVPAVLASRSCPAAAEWSVDFACDEKGKWWLLDMAVAQDSYHYPGCPRRADRNS